MFQTQQKGFCAERRMCSDHGFTLVEIAITIAIAAVILVLAVPSLRSISALNQAIATSNAVVTGLNMARASAITNGDRVSICPSSDGSSCADNSWHRGWIVFNDANADGVAASSEIIRVMSMQSRVSQSGFGDGIVFLSDGTTTLANDVTIISCYSDDSGPDHCLDIEVSAFGKITSSDHVVTESPSDGESVS